MKETEKTQFWEELKSGKFLSMIREASKGQFLPSSQEVYNILKPIFANEDDVEKMYFVFMNRKNRILAIEKMFTGSITGASIYPREVVKKVIAFKSCALVMAHNHPSGDTTPSREDVNITLSVAIPMSCIGVQILDHIIVGNGYYSMADNGTIQKIKERVAMLSTVDF